MEWAAMKVFRPGLRPMYVDEAEPAPVAKPAEPTQAELIQKAKEAASTRHALSMGLRHDGPTLEEYVAAGYDAKTYPPPGFAPNPLERVPTPEDHARMEATLREEQEKAQQPAQKHHGAMFGNVPTELIPPVTPKPLVDHTTILGDPTSVDPLLK